MTTKTNIEKREISRLSTYYEIQAMVDRARRDGLIEADDEVLECAIRAIKEFRLRMAEAIINGRLF